MITRWKRSHRCEAGSCVEVRRSGDEIQVRDSKDPDGPVLSWTPGEWECLLSLFVSGIRPAIVTGLLNGDVQLRGAWMRGGPLTFTAAEWEAFALGVHAREFDLDRLAEAWSVTS